MQYGYPQWGHTNTYGTPNFSGWATPAAPNQAYGAQVAWTTNGTWTTNVSYQANRPTAYQTNTPVMNGPTTTYAQPSFINQNAGPYSYPQATTNNASSASRPATANNNTNQGSAGNQRPATQANAPRRDANMVSSASRPTHNQNHATGAQNVSTSAAGSTGPSKNALSAVNTTNAVVDSNDNYNTGIKLQEVRVGADKALKVMKITPGSSAELCGVIHVGDRLIKIGDVDVFSSYDTARVRDLLSGPRGSRIWMAFENALKAEFEVELVRNVRSIKRGAGEPTQQVGVASSAALTPAVPSKPIANSGQALAARKPEVDAPKQIAAGGGGGAMNRPAQTQAVAAANGGAQGRPAAAPQKPAGSITHGMGNMQIRADPGKAAPAPAPARIPPAAQPSPAGPAARPAQQQQQAPMSNMNMQGRGPQTPVMTAVQQPQNTSQIIYGSRPVTGPFGQYNSMQYTIIGGSLAGSVVGGSHAGSVVGDSLTPSLVIGDWFGGDYV